MDDGLAELLYNAFWGKSPKPWVWADAPPELRGVWQDVATAARGFFESRDRSEIEMLRDANAGWQRLYHETIKGWSRDQ